MCIASIEGIVWAASYVDKIRHNIRDIASIIWYCGHMQDIFMSFLIAWALGALLWADQEIVKSQGTHKKWKAIITTWIRSSILISLLWGLMAYIWTEIDSVAIMVGVGAMSVITFVALGYVYSSFRHDQYGITREFWSIFSYFLWAITVLGYAQIAIMLAIAIAILFMSKTKMGELFWKITHEELLTTLKFCVIALIILPLLPDQKYALNDLPILSVSQQVFEMPFFNPYSIWLFVVLMSGVSYVGYVLSKVIGSDKWIWVSWAIGWLVSSTAVTSAMSALSKVQPAHTNAFVFSTLIANAIMFARVLFIVALFNPALLSSISLPVISMLIVALMSVIYFAKFSKGKQLWEEESGNFESPFQIGPALKFAVFIVAIKFLSGLALIYQDVWGDYALYGVSFFSGFADVDAISQDMSVKSLSGDVMNSVATLAIVIAIFTNTLVKMCIAKFFGAKTYGNKVFYSLGIICLVGVVLALI